MFHYRAALVGKGQLSTGQFFHCGQVLLGDFYLNDIVQHLELLHLTGGQRGKRYAFGKGIAVRGFHFGQRIVTGREFFDIVRLVGRYPAVNFLAVLVGNGQFRAGQFLHCGQILLGEFCLDGVIAHNHGCIVQQFPIIPRPEQQGLLGQIVGLGFLQVAAVLVHLLQQTEGNFIRQRVAIGGAGFGQGIGIAQVQPGHPVGCVGGYPAFHNVAVHILNGQSGTGQFLVIGQIALAYPHFGGFVGTGAFQNTHSLPVVGKGDFHGFFVDIVAQRGTDFLDDILAAVGGGVLVGAAAVLFTADGNIAIEVGGAIRIGFGAGGYQLTGGKNKAAVCIVNVIGGVQVEHGTGKVFAAFQIGFVDADFGLFAVIVEF